VAGVYRYQPRLISILTHTHHEYVEAFKICMPKLHKNRRELVLVVPAAHVTSSLHVCIVLIDVLVIIAICI